MVKHIRQNILLPIHGCRFGYRMPLKASGGKIKLKIQFEFTVPEYGTDRMGRLKTKNGMVYEIAQWFPRVCVYDDIQGWNMLPYVGARRVLS